jgi:hypothetical protein
MPYATKCEWCLLLTNEKDLTLVQIIKWKDEITKGVRFICPTCKEHLKGEYHVPKFNEKSNKYLMLVGKVRYIQKCIRQRLYGDLDRISEDLSKAISDIEKAEKEYIDLLTANRGKREW